MTLNQMLAGVLGSCSLIFTVGCGNSFSGNDYSSNSPATPEPAYYGKPTDIPDANAVRVTAKAKFLYRQLDFNPSTPSSNGLGSVVSTANAVPIPFAEFHIYDSAGSRVQQGETTTDGTAEFELPKTAGTYTLKVFSRALNDYIKVSVLEDIYANTPYSISMGFTVTSSDLSAGTKDLTASPVYAQASETASSKIEGAAFNIMFNVLLANEYIRRNINKNGDVAGTAVSDPNKWFVAEKVTVYWKAGFNPYTYFNYSTPLSFYSPGERKLYILGGVSGNVSTADTDHFDDSVILHEYGHFLEDVYGNSQSPGGSHTGDFVIDPRLAWSEGWANFFQGAVLTGADAHDNSALETRIPSTKRYHYYVDTYGYKGSGSAGIGIAFNLAADGRDTAQYDHVANDLDGTGIFREVSISRSLYKSTRNTASIYTGIKTGGGVLFKDVWKVFSGEEKDNYTYSSFAPYSLVNTSVYPIPNMGLMNWMLSKNGVSSAAWDSILTEEKQTKTTAHYGYLLQSGTGCTYTFNIGTPESYMSSRDTVKRSNPQVNNDFYLYYHDGGSETLTMNYSSTEINLDLILYYGAYVYFEDDNWYAGKSSTYIAKQSRSTVVGTSESVSLAGLPAGVYMLNVKINAYGKTSSDMNTPATYTLYKGAQQLCGTERP